MNTRLERQLIMKLINAFPGKTLQEIKSLGDLELLSTKGVGKKVYAYVKSLKCNDRFNVEQIKHMSYTQRLRLNQESIIDKMKRRALFAVIVVCLLCSNAFAISGVKHYNKLECKRARTGTASYYTYDSCLREGTSGVFTASGEVYDENALTCAMWGVDFGTVVKVTNVFTNQSVYVKVNDRGPSKRLVKKGRLIDLSRGAFEKLADLREGVIHVKIEIQ